MVTNKKTIGSRVLCKLYEINIFNLDKKYTIPIFHFYIPLSILRLLSINFIYLILIKFLLLTTHYEQIIKIFIINIKNINYNIYQKISFEIAIAAQFLKIIVKEINTLKIAYQIRDIKFKYRYFSKENLFIYSLLIKRLVLNIYKHSCNIANTLYSREIKYKYFIIDHL